jgi:hypothetical protein
MISNLHAQRTAIDEQIARESRAEAITAWEAAKAQARAAKQHVGKMRRVFQESAAAWSAYEKECTLVLHALKTHVEQRPKEDDFPTAEELLAWEEKRAAAAAADGQHARSPVGAVERHGAEPSRGAPSRPELHHAGLRGTRRA